MFHHHHHRSHRLLIILVSPPLLLLGLLFLSMLGQKVAPNSFSTTTTWSPDNTTKLAKWSTKAPNKEDDDDEHRRFMQQEKHNVFESSRYGLRIDHCPNGGDPELSSGDQKDGRIKLCQLDAECKPSYKCENILGLTHFGKQMRYCCPTKTSVCTLKPNLLIDPDLSLPLGCHRPLLRTFFYFDIDRLKCVRSRMAQCEQFGENRFESELECRTKCETTACELGESILLHNNSFDRPFLCAADDDCPVGYNCRQDRIFRRSVCCGFLNFEPCPLGFRSFTVPFTGRAKTCRSSATRDECPTDYVCTQNAVSSEQFCCTVEKGVCPEGHQAYIHPLTDGTIKCNLRNFDAITACPPGYVCLAAVFGSSWGFCCAQAMIASCPEDSFPQINPLTNQPQRCELTQQEPDVCTPGFECETDSASHLGFCCSVRKHEKVKPLPEPQARKRTRPPVPAIRTTTPSSTTTTTAMTTTTTNMALSTSATAKVTSGGRKRKKNKEKKRNKVLERKKIVDEDDEEERDHSSASSASVSSSESEQSERADLIELSTKLDRFISGVRRRIQLPRGHLLPTPHIWRLKRKKKWKGWGPEELRRRIFGRRKEEKRKNFPDEEAGAEEEEEEHPPQQIRPKCPHGHRPMAYPGTKWTYLECVVADEKRKGKRKRKGHPDDEEEEEEEKDRPDDLEEEMRRKRKRKRGHPDEEEAPEVEDDEAEDERRRRRNPPDEEDEDVEGRRDLPDEPEEEEAPPSSSICPGPSVCLRARDDPFGRALCCVRKRKEELQIPLPHPIPEAEVEEEEEEEEEEIVETTSSTLPTTTTTIPPATSTTPSTTQPVVLVVLERSDDPTCPRLISGRTCAPGSTDVCREDGFFCQYNKERKEFVCCTTAEG